MSEPTCSDPYEEGCKKTPTPGFSLPNTPHNKGARQPCQSCKYRLRVDERKRLGLPPPRTGASGRKNARPAF